jgi:hypothetical protein
LRGAGSVRRSAGHEDADAPEAMEAVMKRRDAFLGSAILCAALLGGCVMHTVTRGDSNAVAVVVTNFQEGQYETDGEAYLGRKRDASDMIAERNRKVFKRVDSSARARGCC